jgi:hypothetical protein
VDSNQGQEHSRVHSRVHTPVVEVGSTLHEDVAGNHQLTAQSLEVRMASLGQYCNALGLPGGGGP